MSFNVSPSDKQGLNNEISTSPGPETGSYITRDAPLKTDFQRPPHRAWEEGYQSPFSQTYHDQMKPRYNESLSIRPRGAQLSFSPENAAIRQPSPSVPNAHSDFSLAAVHPSTTPQHPTTVPPSQRRTYQPRMKRVITKELTLEGIDISALVTLGMSPFMTGQDLIANQNRFVRNECIFAHHFVRLQRVTTDSNARHAAIEQNIYEHLEQHKLALTRFGGGVKEASAVSNDTGARSLRTDPDFRALEKAHELTRLRLEELSQQVAESSESIKRTLMDLARRLDEFFAENRATT